MSEIKSISFAQKPTMFIASSSEGYTVANRIKQQLSELVDINIWNEEDIFFKDKTYLSSLLNLSSFYDYAIMVLTADDVLMKRKEEGKAPRDNVIFEFGLFLGRIGPRRTFAVCEESLHLPSDFFKVPLFTFRKEKTYDGPDFEKSIHEIGNELAEDIKDFGKDFEFSLLPSTTLAIGYYRNFLGEVIMAIKRREKVELIAGKGDQETIETVDWNTTKIKLYILLPDTLAHVLRDSEEFKEKTFEDEKVIVHGKRRFPLYRRRGTDISSGVLKLYDIPTTLNSSYFVIQEIFHEDFLKVGDRYDKVNRKEILNFEMTLRKLIPDDVEDITILFEKMSDFE